MSNWYGSTRSYKGRRGKVQIEDSLRSRSSPLRTLPEHILRLADAEYQRQFGGSQDYERMQERGGLGVLEVVSLLADYLDRMGAEPSKPRKETTDG